jgi:hypothetical protein
VGARKHRTGRAPARRVALIWYQPIYAQSPSIKSTVHWSVLAIGGDGGSYSAVRALLCVESFKPARCHGSGLTECANQYR